MRRTLISLGFDATQAIALIGRLGVGSADEFVFVSYSEETPRAELAARAVESYFTELRASGSGANYRFLRLSGSVDDDVLSLASECVGHEASMYAVGGMRYAVVAMFLACQACGCSYYVINEAKPEVTRMPCPAIQVSRPSLRVLRALSYGRMSLRELASELGRSRSSVARQLRQLEALGLAGGGSGYSLTGLGRAVLLRQLREVEEPKPKGEV